MKTKTPARTIVIATPHSRHDRLEKAVRGRLRGIKVVRVRSRRELSRGKLERINPDFVFFPHWSWLIPEDIHSRFNCVIFHMTDLPYGRGGTPLQNLIVRGHRETLLTAFKCAAGLDAGPVFLKRRLSLAGAAEEILRRASVLMEKMIVEIVECRPEPSRQTGKIVKFERRRPEDGDMAALTGLRQVYDYIRMLDAEGYPPAFLKTKRLRVEFTGARLGRDFVEAKVRVRISSND